MKTIFYILQKEFLQVFRNRMMVPMIFGIPLVQMLILVYAATFEMKKIDMVVVDHDFSPTSRGLIAKFSGIPFYNTDRAVSTVEEGENLLTDNEADMVLVLPAGLERDLMREDVGHIQLLINAIDGNSAQLIHAYSQFVIRDFNQMLIADWKGMPGFAAPVSIHITENYWYNPVLDYKWYMAPGILAILVTIIGMFLTGMNLVREKETGTIEQLNVTPIRKHQFIAGKLIPFWLIALFDLAFGLFIAWLVFNLPIVGSLGLLFGFAGIYLLGILGLGLFISTVAHTQQQVMFVSFFFMIIFILMGGIFTPVESMPEWAQIVNHANPVFYFMRILRMILLKGSGFHELIKEFFGLLFLGILFLSLAIRRYRKTV
jgi:ABC-2 type transport system permease protein